MTRPASPPLTRAVVARGIGFGLAIALGAVAVWLIVTGSTSPRRIEIGVLAGLWGLLLGAYTMFGARRQHVESTVFAAQSELAHRSSGGLEPVGQAEARRAFEERLEHLLRTEIATSVNREVGDLRREVAQLRHELLEKVGGQLRLERIETTRLIGSDLEALQLEVRQLKTARDTIAPARPAIDPAETARAIDAERRRAVQARQEQVRHEQALHEQATRQAAAAENAARERAAMEQAARHRAAREKAAAEQAAHEIEARRKAAAEKAAAEKAAAEKAAAEKAATEKAAAEKAATEKAAAEKAAAERVARDKAAREQAAAEKAGREAARQQAEAEKAAREQAAAEQAAREQAAAEQAAREQAAREQAAREQAAREQAAAEQAAREHAARTINGSSPDPFASLPRITPFTDFELDPIETPEPTRNGTPNGHDVEPAADAYTGRRRAGADDDDPGRHTAQPVDATASPIDNGAQPVDVTGHAADDDLDRRGGRRRRRTDDDASGLDLLSQLLSRESAER